MNISQIHEVKAYAAAVAAYRVASLGNKGAAASLAAFCSIPAACGYEAAKAAGMRIGNMAVQSEQDAAALTAAMMSEVS